MISRRLKRRMLPPAQETVIMLILAPKWTNMKTETHSNTRWNTSRVLTALSTTLMVHPPLAPSSWPCSTTYCGTRSPIVQLKTCGISSGFKILVQLKVHHPTLCLSCRMIRHSEDRAIQTPRAGHWRFAERAFNAYQNKTMEVIDACPKGCILYYSPKSAALRRNPMHADNSHRTYCPNCSEERYLWN
jgi:hypothetical protein